jgi:hypothetical protein
MNYPNLLDAVFKIVLTLVFFNVIVLRDVAYVASFLI